ncbi:MAG TPA: hypothetical protein VNN80_29630 [Polyangiaceae bacterium]|nr:hypothetical protein [Polyangiaceae bacterium]
MPETKREELPIQSQTAGSAAAEDAVEAQLARQVAELSATLGTPEAGFALASLRVVEEDWARHALGVDMSGTLASQARRSVERGVPLDRLERALPHAKRAVQRQWDLGSFATGSGEGLAVMAEVRELQTALAWLHAGIARHDPVRARHAAEAQRLAREIREDSNGSGRSCERSLRALDELLARLETGAAPQRH